MRAITDWIAPGTILDGGVGKAAVATAAAVGLVHLAWLWGAQALDSFRTGITEQARGEDSGPTCTTGTV
ncbi:hypothetical protein [Kitasatospora sp. NPDC005856]|uniref:hypothetical protein n=1 Tax=Kitasatospora sp. NPDC005856 TaxID=3154566 RepID=UPI0033C72638